MSIQADGLCVAEIKSPVIEPWNHTSVFALQSRPDPKPFDGLGPQQHRDFWLAANYCSRVV